jgi:hypothetical protein
LHSFSGYLPCITFWLVIGDFIVFAAILSPKVNTFHSRSNLFVVCLQSCWPLWFADSCFWAVQLAKHWQAFMTHILKSNDTVKEVQWSADLHKMVIF